MVVVTFENSAFNTFRVAQTIGARCVLDAISLHHRTVVHFMTVKSTAYLAEINHRIDEEVAWTALILT